MVEVRHKANVPSTSRPLFAKGGQTDISALFLEFVPMYLVFLLVQAHKFSPCFCFLLTFHCASRKCQTSFPMREYVGLHGKI